jgi:2-octaprenyl-6-methoxyphenol hydroxylase
MTNLQNFDIAIIGGSFSGMTAALALANISPDLKIAIIERQDILNNDKKPDGRVYAMSSQSLELFGEIGILEEIKKSAGIIQDIKITDYKSPIILDFLSAKIGAKNFGFLVENFIIHNALRDELRKRNNVSIFIPNCYKNIDFDDEKKLARVEIDDGRILQSKLLLACDGRISALRELFNVYTVVKNYHQNAIVFNISHELEHKNTAWEKFLYGGPLAILPLQNPLQSSIVWISKKEESDAIFKLDDENFTHFLAKKMENCLGKVEVISEKFSYPLILVEAQKFYHKKMLLVGDAACGVHPIAGQGFNLGIAGIKILRDLIKEYFFCGLEINSDQLIERYNCKTRAVTRKMVVATDILNSLFETKNPIIKIARELGLFGVEKFPIIKNFLIKNAGGS